jgi:hypothetical protein
MLIHIIALFRLTVHFELRGISSIKLASVWRTFPAALETGYEFINPAGYDQGIFNTCSVSVISM